MFFGGLAVEFWTSVAPPPSDQEIAFLQHTFGNADAILDIACGAGRYSIPLARAGYRVTGIDLSADFLAIARRTDPSIEWRRCDLRDIDDVNHFDGGLCFGNSFGYLPRDETRDVLRRIGRALKTGARFVLETSAIAEVLLPHLQLERRIEGPIVMTSRAAYDATDSRLDTEYIFEKGSQCEVKNARLWVFAAGEVAAMLRDAGFAVESVFASATGEPFVVGSPRALFVAQRIE